MQGFSGNSLRLKWKLGVVLALGLAAGACATNTGSATVRFSTEPQKTAVGDYLKGRFAARQQKLEIAADAYERAVDAAPTDAALLRYAFFYELAAGNVDRARPFADKLLLPEFANADIASKRSPSGLARPSRSLPQLTVAADQMTRGQYDAASATLSEESESRFAESISFLMRAWATYEVDGLTAALAALDNPAPELFTGFTPLHKALMYDLDGDTENATKFYQLALASYANQIGIFAYADFLERSGQTDDAIELYRNLSEDNGALRRAGRMGLIRLGEPLEGETRETLRQARRRPERLVSNGAEGAALALHNFAWASYEQAVSERAAASRAGFNNMKLALNTPLAFSQLALHLNNDLDAAHYLTGAIYTDYELYGDAVDALEQVSYAHPLYEYAVTDTAGAFEMQERESEAVSLLREFVERDMLSPDAGLRLANLLAEREQYDEADRVLSEAIMVAENLAGDKARKLSLWRYYFARGAMRLEADRWEAAETDLKKAIELSPEEPFVLNFLGYSWAERGENLEEAFAMIEKALKLRPNSGAIVDSLGWAHYQLGHYDEAVKTLERAVQLEPADPVITDHLGDAYWQTGRSIQAKYEWRRVLTLDVEDPELMENVRRKLGGGLVEAGAAANRQRAQ